MSFSGSLFEGSFIDIRYVLLIFQDTKNQDFILFLEDTFFEKSEGVGVKANPTPAILGLRFILMM